MTTTDRLEGLLNRIEKQLDALSEVAGLEQKDIWTIKEAAAYTGLSTATLAEMARTHEISACKNGKTWYFNRYDVKNWMQRNRMASDDELLGKAAIHCMKNPLRGIRKKEAVV